MTLKFFFFKYFTDIFLKYFSETLKLFYVAYYLTFFRIILLI